MEADFDVEPIPVEVATPDVLADSHHDHHPQQNNNSQGLDVDALDEVSFLMEQLLDEQERSSQLQRELDQVRGDLRIAQRAAAAAVLRPPTPPLAPPEEKDKKEEEDEHIPSEYDFRALITLRSTLLASLRRVESSIVRLGPSAEREDTNHSNDNDRNPSVSGGAASMETSSVPASSLDGVGLSRSLSPGQGGSVAARTADGLMERLLLHVCPLRTVKDMEDMQRAFLLASQTKGLPLAAVTMRRLRALTMGLTSFEPPGVDPADNEQSQVVEQSVQNREWATQLLKNALEFVVSCRMYRCFETHREDVADLLTVEDALTEAIQQARRIVAAKPPSIAAVAASTSRPPSRSRSPRQQPTTMNATTPRARSGERASSTTAGGSSSSGSRPPPSTSSSHVTTPRGRSSSPQAPSTPRAGAAAAAGSSSGTTASASSKKTGSTATPSSKLEESLREQRRRKERETHTATEPAAPATNPTTVPMSMPAAPLSEPGSGSATATRSSGETSSEDANRRPSTPQQQQQPHVLSPSPAVAIVSPPPPPQQLPASILKELPPLPPRPRHVSESTPQSSPSRPLRHPNNNKDDDDDDDEDEGPSIVHRAAQQRSFPSPAAATPGDALPPSASHSSFATTPTATVTGRTSSGIPKTIVFTRSPSPSAKRAEASPTRPPHNESGSDDVIIASTSVSPPRAPFASTVPVQRIPEDDDAEWDAFVEEEERKHAPHHHPQQQQQRSMTTATAPPPASRGPSAGRMMEDTGGVARRRPVVEPHAGAGRHVHFTDPQA